MNISKVIPSHSSRRLKSGNYQLDQEINVACRRRFSASLEDKHAIERNFKRDQQCTSLKNIFSRISNYSFDNTNKSN